MNAPTKTWPYLLFLNWFWNRFSSSASGSRTTEPEFRNRFLNHLAGGNEMAPGMLRNGFKSKSRWFRDSS